MLDGLIQELDKTHMKVADSRREMLNRIDALTSELNNAKQNIT